MNKTELIDRTAAAAGMSRASMARALDALTATIVNAVASGDSVSLLGFGTFKTQDRKARVGKNPKTGDTLVIAAKRLPRFQPGAAFKISVNQPVR